MRNVDTAIGDALHDCEDLGTGGGTSQTDVENGGEGIGVVALQSLHIVVLAVDLIGTFVELVQVELLEVTTSQQQSGAIGGRVVGKTDLDAVAWQFVSVGRVDDDVTTDTSIGDLKRARGVGIKSSEGCLPAR